uniref:Ras and EF-hand domain-containing protein homolog n=1 Tax=Dermatophagoides pteronyssinus TaxID=6956 RepID=A0A6P6Y8I1_DERPT|nr:ras and EF-hand domain-containing protein homolog [Dermatophagoides pteronyssinus]
MDGVYCNARSANGGQVADHNKLATKTGTTICGLLTREGVVLAADCRATAGSFIATRNCLKLHRLSKSIWCAGAGVAADLHHVTENIAANMQLLKASLGAEIRIDACVRMLSKVLREHHGDIIVALIVAGINPDGTMDLVYVDADGSTLRADFLAMGSGGFFARSMLENGYRKDLTLQEGVELAADAIEAGILNDLGSGSNVDVLSIREPADSRIIVVGDSAVGKSNLLLRYVKNGFHADTRTTIGVEFATKFVELDGNLIKVQFWDTAGQERYHSITQIYYRNSSAAMVCYDITSHASFRNCKRWVDEVRAELGTDMFILLVGTKLDLDHRRQVSVVEAKNFAHDSKLAFIELSALEDKNVASAFETVIRGMHANCTKCCSNSSQCRPSMENVAKLHQVSR